MRAALVFTLLCASCRSSSDPQAKHILSAYRAVEEAPTHDKKQALAALAAAPCGGSTCGARDACVRYATALHEARTHLDEAKRYGPVDAGGSGAATPSVYAVIVGAADDATKEATAAEPACAQALMMLSKLANP